MILVGVQYYRPPFPDAKYWEDDLARMADGGFNTVQFWVKWAWVEPEPGRFVFDDYDRLMELARRKGLGVVLSTIAEVQPQWIHREVPGCELVDNMGHRVVSSNRGECHFGLTPGGCFDHPGVWERMAGFLSATVTRYRGAANLRGWDAWNELRWNVHADGLVCYCPHTLRAFRGWLERRHGGLDGLNRAWQRRYASWLDVMPGKMPRSPYTEMMAFQHFITCRADAHAEARYDLMKALDPAHPVTVHGDAPSVLHGGGYPHGTALYRGSDWAFADRLDGIGTSSFPHWMGMDDDDFRTRLDFTASAARGKRVWLSEIQGGRAAHGFQVHTPVPPADQQRWIWTGLSRGAEAILFWCWRDEVFGCESAGFGIAGRDGRAEERLEAMRRTARVLRRHGALLGGYRPDAPRAGVFFSPQSYYLHWIEERSAGSAVAAVTGYARALVRQNIPYTVVEESHLDVLAGLRILFMPRAIVMDDATAEALAAFVRKGGTILCESECGAFASNGIYRLPEDRFLARLAGIEDVGRRSLGETAIRARLGDAEFTLPARQWLTPLRTEKGEALAGNADGALLADVPAGKGRVIASATYMGDAYLDGARGKRPEYAGCGADFEAFVRAAAVRAGAAPAADVAGVEGNRSPIHVRTGRSGRRRVAFVLGAGRGIRLAFPAGFFSGGVRELLTGRRIEPEPRRRRQACAVPDSDWGVAVLADGF